jgi:hypothetical protein
MSQVIVLPPASAGTVDTHFVVTGVYRSRAVLTLTPQALHRLTVVSSPCRSIAPT